MDITILFKACVKTVRTTNKALGLNNNKTTSILNLKSKKDVNLIKAKEIVKQLSHLKQFLFENKAAYLNIINYLSTNKTMTESDREHVDLVAEKIVHTCSNLISEYKKEIGKLKKTKQMEDHYNTVIETIESYLKDVSKIYTEAKAVRVKRVIEIHNLSKLGPSSNKRNVEKNDLAKHNLDDTNEHSVIKKTIIPEIVSSPTLELSAEEIQMFETENESLYNELNSMSDEVKQMESKIVHIAELQEMFTEKVLQQESDIERIATVAAGSTEYIKDANEQIRQAMQRNAGLRVWVLFFLLVMSFSLLFLDWYNE